MQRRISQKEFLPKGIMVIGATVLFTATVILGRTYFSYINGSENINSEGVLGEKSVVEAPESVCTSTKKLEFELKTNGVSIPLYAPNGDFSFEVGNITSCISFPTCNSDSSCSNSTVAADSACINTYLNENPIILNDELEIKGENRSIVIRKQDWVVAQDEFSKQVATLLSRELSYCELSGEAKIEDSRLTAIVVPVTDILPSAPKGFAKRFIEIDQSKEKLYLWQDGIYQEYKMLSGVDVGDNRLVIREDIDMTRFLGSADREFVLKTTKKNDFVVIHE